MKQNISILIVALVIGFFFGYSYNDRDLFEVAKDCPKGVLDVPAQWFMMESTVGWEKMMLIFGYVDDIEVCEHLVDIAKKESPDRDFRCTDVN